MTFIPDVQEERKLDFTNELDTIFQLESSAGTDPKRLKPNKYGALGSYQLTPPAFEDLQTNFPEKYKDKKFDEVALDDNQARDAAGDYVSLIRKRLVKKNIAPTRNAILAGYHSGVGNLGVGKRPGPEEIKYINKADELFNFELNERKKKQSKQPGPQSKFIDLFQMPEAEAAFISDEESTFIPDEAAAKSTFVEDRGASTFVPDK